MPPSASLRSDGSRTPSSSFRQATQVEPLDPIAHTFVGIGWILRRRYEDAVKSFHAALELEPNLSLAHGYLGEAYCHQHRYEEAAAELQKAQPTPPGCHFSVGLLGYCYGRWGKTGEAERLLSRLQELSKTSYVPALSFAMTHIGMNNNDLALECLNRAYEERYGALVWLPLARIIHEEADYSRKTNAPVWYKGCAHRPFATTEALA